MSLADELKAMILAREVASEGYSVAIAEDLYISDFVLNNQDAILAALRNMETINLDAEGFRALRRAASKSPWIPPEYVVNDWLADCVDFLSNPLPPHRDAVLEEAAKVCENALWSMPIDEFQKMTKREHSDRACHECAAAIRAMKENKHG